MSEVTPIPIPRNDVVEAIRQIAAESNRVFISSHAKERMAERRYLNPGTFMPKDRH